ncbi:hypothetical protein D3C78_1790010 [compost metagenome]
MFHESNVDGGSGNGVVVGVFVAGVPGARGAELQQAERQGTQGRRRVCIAGMAKGCSQDDSDIDFQRLPDHRAEHHNRR